MTSMLTRQLLQMPDPDDLTAIEQHKRAVLRHFRTLFESVDDALRTACPKVLTLFQLWEGRVDLAVHAPNIRYLVKQFLAMRSTLAIDDDEISFEMQRVSNCGLCIEAEIAQIRILKATPAGLPKAASIARTHFVEKNQQLSFRFEVNSIEPLVPNLGLFVIWRMDGEYKYVGMEIACPRRKRDDGSIECYWIEPYKRSKLFVAPAPKKSSEKSDDLDIKRRERQKSANEDRE